MKRGVAIAVVLAAAIFGYRDYPPRTNTSNGSWFTVRGLRQQTNPVNCEPRTVNLLHAVQTVLFNPPVVESAVRPAMYAKMNQVVTMRKVGGGWKIASFENKFDKMDSLSSR